jgi:murein L,D-transpeptidase YcbB/YkuD
LYRHGDGGPGWPRRGAAAAIALLTAGTLGGCEDRNRSTHSQVPGIEQAGHPDTVEPRVDTAAARLEAVLLEGTPPAYVPAFVWDVVRRYYDARRYAPRWTGPQGLTQDGRALLAVLCALETEGLASPVLSDLPDPGDSTRAVVQGAADLGELDLRLTAALLTAADALRSGQMHPDSLFSAWHVAAPEAISDTAAAALLADSAPAHALLTLRNGWPEYRSLREAARHLLASEAAEDTISSLPTKLQPGQRDSAVAALRHRLIINGELDSTSRSGLRYDARVVSAVRSFQRRHGLTASGRLDSTTRAELAMPIDRRFDLVAANLERYRWLPDPAESGPMLLVDLATGRLEGHADGQLTWTDAARVAPCSAGLPPMLADTIHGVREEPGGIALELGNQRRVHLLSRIAAPSDSGEPCIVVSRPAAVAALVRRTRQPVLLYLLWPTTWVDKRDGRLHFRQDASGQDQALMRALPQTARPAPACTR